MNVLALVNGEIVEVAVSSGTVTATVRNETGSTLLAGQVVYLSGASGNKPLALLAQADAESTSSNTLGIVQSDINDQFNGTVLIIGEITGLDTSAFSDGDIVYLSPTVAGGLTNTKPIAPDHAVKIGIVTHSHQNQGSIQVLVQNGYELDELHNVDLTDASTGDLLYKSASGVWKALTIASLQNSLTGKADIVDGKIPASQLPSYVDDVLEFATFVDFPAEGENGKIYIDIETNVTYRWGGSIYVAIGSSLALGETEFTAYRGDRGKTAYDHSQVTGSNPHNFGISGVNGLQSALNSINSTLVDKVDKIDGWSLTQYNFSLTYKEAIDNLSSVYVAKVSGKDLSDQNFTLTYKEAIDNLSSVYVAQVAGYGLSKNDYSDSEKSRLANTSGTNTGDQDLSGLATKLELYAKVDKVSGKQLSANDFTNALKSRLESIQDQVQADASITDPNNIAYVKNLATLLSGKVDKETGKILTSNDFTNYYKTLIDSLTGAALSNDYEDLINKPLLAYVPLSQKGVASGVAPLNSSGKVDAVYLPFSALNAKGGWDTSTNTPQLINGTGANGDSWFVTKSGYVNLTTGASSSSPLPVVPATYSNSTNIDVSGTTITFDNVKQETVGNVTYYGYKSSNGLLFGVYKFDNQAVANNKIGTLESFITSDTATFVDLDTLWADRATLSYGASGLFNEDTHVTYGSSGTQFQMGDAAIYFSEANTYVRVGREDAVTSVNGQQGVIVLTTTHITEGDNLYFTADRARGINLTGLSTATGTAITTSDTLIVALGKLQKQVTDTNAAIATSITNAISALTTDNIAEGSNTARRYFTEARALATTLLGFSATSTAIVTQTDTVLSSIGKLQGQITDLKSKAVTKVNGVGVDGNEITITADDIGETATRKWFTESAVLATALTGLSLTTNSAITASDNILVAMGKLQAQITATITKINDDIASTSTTINAKIDALTTDNIPEGPSGSRKYLNDTNVRNVTLSGISFATSTPIQATDNILSAFGKIQAQINNTSGASMVVTPVYLNTTFTVKSNEQRLFTEEIELTINGEIDFENSRSVLCEVA